MDSASQTGDTGSVCEPQLLGSGCSYEPGPTGRCEVATEGGDNSVQPLPGEVRGGGVCGCDSAPSFGMLPVVVALMLTFFRRYGPALVLMLAAFPAAGQVDAQRLRITDGGDFPALWEGDLGTRWTGAATFSMNRPSTLAVLEGVAGSGVLLDRVWTWEGAASLNLGGLTRFGIALPFHAVTFNGQRIDGLQRGDMAIWLSVPVTGEENPIRGSWTVRVDIPTGQPQWLLGGTGVVTGLFASQFPAGPLTASANLGAAFQRDVALPGSVWGNHWIYGLGLRAEPAGPTWVTAELLGEAPVQFWAGEPARYPAEVLWSLGVVPTTMLSVGGGLGAGLSRGLGASKFRVIALVDVRVRTERDQDDDGIADLRDLCRLEPEDHDGFRDSDGCPDLDNDQDGFPDVRDDCPGQAEVINQFEDFDGCPDRISVVVVDVVAVPGLEQATVQIGASRPVVVFPGEPLERRSDIDSVIVEVLADGFHPGRTELQLTGERVLHEVRLEPIEYGTLQLVVTDEDGNVLTARVRVGDDPDLQVVSGPLRWVAGEVELEVGAQGFLPQTVAAAVPANEEIMVSVTLRRARISVEAGRLQLEDRIGFELDNAALDGPSVAVVSDLAAWLRAHPEVRLLRVEGHADPSGASQHNYELSLRRAEAVQQALVAAGVAATRLDAIGTGEARTSGTEVADRRVEFLVLVWEEPDPAPTPPATW